MCPHDDVDSRCSTFQKRESENVKRDGGRREEEKERGRVGEVVYVPCPGGVMVMA